MHRTDHPTAAPVLPTPAPAGTPGFFTEGDPLTATPPTVVGADIMNAIVEELANAITDSGQPLDKGDTTQLSQAISRFAGSSYNALLNPEGAIAQHESNPLGTTDTFGSADRWRGRRGGAGDVAELTGGSLGAPTDLVNWPSRPRSALRFRKTTDAATGISPRLVQFVESALTFADSDVVVAFDAAKYSGADIPILSVELVQDFGNLGSPSADVTTALTAITTTTIDTTPRRFVFRGHLPSVVGKTFGGGGGDHVKVRITFAANTGVFDMRLSALVFALGRQDPGFIARAQTTERDLCRRYFETSIQNPSWGNFSGDSEPALWDTGFAGAGKVATLGRRFFVFKYRVPTITWYAIDGTPNNITEGAATLHPVTVPLGVGEPSPSPDHTGYPTITTPPASGTLRLFRAYYSADAEITD